MATSNSASDANYRAEVIEGLLRMLHEHYVYPDVAAAIEDSIRRRLSNHEYDTVTTGAEFCTRLTTHLQEISHDKHLHVRYSDEPQPPHNNEQPTPDERAEWQQDGMLHNFGFEKVERLPGNIGYLDLRTFFNPEFAGETAVAAMNLLAYTSALIIDLRQNRGGHASMVALLASYLFDEHVELSGIYWRAQDRINQSWVLPYVPGRRYVDKPVYVLTSDITFSAAEAFAYDLKHLKRAILIGEITGGGAHPGGGYSIDEHFAIAMPMGRAVNPVTGTNWEGTGVIPDCIVPQDEAFKVAYREALKKTLEAVGANPPRALKELIDEARTALKELGK